MFYFFPDILALFIWIQVVPDSDTLYMVTNQFPLTDTPNGKPALAFPCYHSHKPYHTNDRCFAAPKLCAASISCYLLFGTQSVKDIPILWKSEVIIIRMSYRHICFGYLPRKKDIAVMFKLWLYCHFYYLCLCYFG